MNTEVPETSGRKRRRDFEQNRDAILATASDVFIELGVGASMNVVAERAGVSPATLYRHFPNKSALVDAVFDLRVLQYADAIEEAQSIEDPRAAFRRTMHTIVELQARDRSFREIFATFAEIPFDHEGFQRFGTALLTVFANARSAGVIRKDVADEDIMLALLATEGIARPVSQHSSEAMARLVDIALDGVCATQTELTGSALALDQLLDAAGN